MPESETALPDSQQAEEPNDSVKHYSSLASRLAFAEEMARQEALAQPGRGGVVSEDLEYAREGIYQNHAGED